MTLRTIRSGSHQFRNLTYRTPANPNKSFRSSPSARARFPAFLQRLSSASNLTAADARAIPVTKRHPKHKKSYHALSLLELLEWEFMCWKPSLDNHNLLLTRNGIVDRDLNFVDNYTRAYGDGA